MPHGFYSFSGSLRMHPYLYICNHRFSDFPSLSSHPNKPFILLLLLLHRLLHFIFAMSAVHSSHTSQRRLRSLCCFRPTSHKVLDGDDRDVRTASSRSENQEHELEIKEAFHRVIARINYGKSRRQGGSVDFRYDPESYALNFEDGNRVDELPIRSFAARLPASPLQKGEELPALGRGEIVVYR